MIVVIGVLVGLAALLLALGWAGSGLGLIYASILLSVLAGVLLVLRVVLAGRARARVPAAPATVPVPVRPPVPVAAVAAPPRAEERPATPGPVAPAPPEPGREDGDALQRLLAEGLLDDGDGLAIVVVVPGRPRYHLDGCPELGDETGIDLDVLEARDEGFSPCATCRPDATIAEQVEDELAADRDDRPAAPEPSGPVPSVAGSVLLPPEPPADTPNPEQTFEPAPDPVPLAVPEGSVVVVPDRGTFHRASCPTVEEVPGLLVLGRADAVRQGYRSCGTCRA